MFLNRKPLFFLIFGIEITIGIILFVIGFFTKPEEMLDDKTPLQFFFYIVGAVLTIGPIVAIIALYSISLVKKSFASNLKSSGLRGSASVISVSPVLGKLNNLCRIDIVMEINVPGKAPYKIEHGEYMDIKYLDRVKPGTTLSVLVDSHNPKKLLINW